MVEQGEVIEITDRGRPVGVLGPPPDGSPLERLRAAGEVGSAIGDLNDLPEPIVLASGAEPPSQVLERLRQDER